MAAYIAKHTAKVGGDAAAVAAIEASVASTFASMSADTHPVPRGAPTTLPAEGDYHVGLVQPVLHYTMGGLGIEADTANAPRPLLCAGVRSDRLRWKKCCAPSGTSVAPWAGGFASKPRDREPNVPG